MYVVTCVCAHMLVSVSMCDNSLCVCMTNGVGVGYEGDTCSFTCNTDYELTGSNTRTCQSDGRWSGSDDACRIDHHMSCIMINKQM